MKPLYLVIVKSEFLFLKKTDAAEKDGADGFLLNSELYPRKIPCCSRGESIHGCIVSEETLLSLSPIFFNRCDSMGL